MSKDASNQTGQNGTDNGRSNVAIDGILHEDLKVLQFRLRKTYPTMRNMVDVALRGFHRKECARLEKAGKRVAG